MLASYKAKEAFSGSQSDLYEGREDLNRKIKNLFQPELEQTNGSNLKPSDIQMSPKHYANENYYKDFEASHENLLKEADVFHDQIRAKKIASNATDAVKIASR